MTNKIKTVRMNPLARRELILNTAIDLAIEKGFRNLTRSEVAKQSKCAQGLISHYFINVANLKQEILKVAIEKEIIPILAERWTTERLRLSDSLTQRVIHYLTN